MSAWYVWGALGLYPQTPSRGEMLLSSPTFPRVWIKRHHGPTIIVSARGAGDEAVYVQSVRLDGRVHSRSWIPASVLNRGGDLQFVVGDQPRRSWGAAPAARPVDHGMR